MNPVTLFWILIACGLGQLTISLLNLRLVQILRWQQELHAMPLLLREVFHVHKYFISLTVALFGTWTILFAEKMASGSDPVANALAAGIALFWGIRAVMQVTYYSSSHWKARSAETAVHVTLLLAYGAMALTYGVAASGVGR